MKMCPYCPPEWREGVRQGAKPPSKGRMIPRWTNEDIALLRRVLNEEIDINEAVKILRRTKDACRKKIIAMDIKEGE